MKMTRFLLVLGVSALLLAAVSCNDDSGPVRPGPGGVTGRVTELEGGAPIAGAGVLLIDPTTLVPAAPIAVTDSSGSYSVSDVPGGRYAVFVYHRTRVVYDPAAPAVDVTGGKTTTYDMRLQNPELWNGNGVAVSGRVTDAVTGDPVAGVFVSAPLWEIAGQDVSVPFWGISLPWWGVTDSDGRFSISASQVVDGGSSTPTRIAPLNFTAEGYAPYTLVGSGEAVPGLAGPPIPVPGDSALVLDIRLSRPSAGNAGSLRGRVIFRGQPASGVRVGLSLVVSAHPDTLPPATLAPLNIVPGHTAVSGSDGSFRIEGLTPGTYALVPAYPIGDGYVGDLAPFWGPSKVIVYPGITADAGDVPIIRAIEAVSPPEGGLVGSRTPRFEWGAVEGAQFYELQYSTHYVMGPPIGPVTGTHWDVPSEDPLPPGTHVRWMVTAFGVAGTDTVLVGDVEVAHTFTVEP